MRIINVNTLTQNIKDMCIKANHFLAEDMDQAMKHALDTEQSPLGRQILDQLQDNLKIAAEDMIPICQDSGMAVVFLKVGQDVHFEGGSLEDAVNEGVRQGYVEGFLRKSVVGDPIIRENTKDNTQAVIHYSIVPGDKVEIKVAPKGFGSENMSRVFMLKPADGIEGVKNAILTAVRDAGPNACPPMVVGVGIGGTFEKCALMAKEALTREAGSHSEIPWVKDLEEEMLDTVNKLGIGPGGLGGTTTALAVNVNTYPTHIAGLPVAVNICCHVNRHIIREVLILWKSISQHLLQKKQQNLFTLEIMYMSPELFILPEMQHISGWTKHWTEAKNYQLISKIRQFIIWDHLLQERGVQ